MVLSSSARARATSWDAAQYDAMPSEEISRRIEQELGDLRERHTAVEPGVIDHYYVPGGDGSPPESCADGDPFAISLCTLDGELHRAGDHELRFALQSISKVFSYALALEDHGRDGVLPRVGVEPSGEAFNSLEFDERNRRPHNPMVNAGALATTDLVRGGGDRNGGGDGGQRERLVGSMRAYAGNDDLDIDEETLELELAHADRNRGIAYLMRSGGMLEGEAEDVLRLYLQQCSVLLTCDDLAVMAATFANGGRNPRTGVNVLATRHVRDVLSVMHTCGMYDFAGQWAFEVGVPAKSGVSGGIMAVIPGKLGIGVFSPGLDVYGNSVRGVRVCEEISDRLGLHVFAAEDDDELLGTDGPLPADE
jgi:glutaminase